MPHAPKKCPSRTLRVFATGRNLYPECTRNHSRNTINLQGVSHSLRCHRDYSIAEFHQNVSPQSIVSDSLPRCVMRVTIVLNHNMGVFPQHIRRDTVIRPKFPQLTFHRQRMVELRRRQPITALITRSAQNVSQCRLHRRPGPIQHGGCHNRRFLSSSDARRILRKLEQTRTRTRLLTQKHPVVVDAVSPTQLKAQEEQLLIVKHVCHLQKRKFWSGDKQLVCYPYGWIVTIRQIDHMAMRKGSPPSVFSGPDDKLIGLR